MPPPDVLMVWHSYMLNPRAYLDDCLRLGWMQLWHTTMPWEAVASCIDSKSFVYDAGKAAAENFIQLTGRPWDNLEDAATKSVGCPGCQQVLQVPWTTVSCAAAAPASTVEELATSIDSILSTGRGHCEKDFKFTCPNCKVVVTHDTQEALKFCRHLKALLEDDMPMSGTMFGLNGIPNKTDPLSPYSLQRSTGTPNDIFRGQLGNQILTQCVEAPDSQSMASIRKTVEAAIGDATFISKLRSDHGNVGPQLQFTEKVAIRRMMSRYWGNSSTFALDLVGAVIRQGTFVEKMNGIDWLHSPALANTMQRLLVKYQRFVSIMSDPWNMAVPTLDVDLAWHTHQLSPYSYMQYTIKTTKQFIDHADKVVESKLNTAFEWTSKTYQSRYGEPYSECMCWYCCAVRESITSAASRLFHSRNAKADAKLRFTTHAPAKSVHISAHNAVRPTDDAAYTAGAHREAARLEAMYKEACERARRKGRAMPPRNDYYYSEAYGYPVYIPAYSPYLGYMPFTPLYYPTTPGCMALGQGAAGNCCSGTCGGGVAAGACAGAAGCAGASGSCAGGGGCGGGGGGGC